MSYPLLDIFLTMLWFFLWIAWIFLLFWIVVDIFRSRDLGGWAKAGWLVFVIVLPFLGVFVYLIARGGNMHERRAGSYQTHDTFPGSYDQPAATTTANGAGELAKLASLRDRGVISESEFQQGKAKILG